MFLYPSKTWCYPCFLPLVDGWKGYDSVPGRAEVSTVLEDCLDHHPVQHQLSTNLYRKQLLLLTGVLLIYPTLFDWAKNVHVPGRAEVSTALEATTFYFTRSLVSTEKDCFRYRNFLGHSTQYRSDKELKRMQQKFHLSIHHIHRYRKIYKLVDEWIEVLFSVLYDCWKIYSLM